MKWQLLQGLPLVLRVHSKDARLSGAKPEVYPGEGPWKVKENGGVLCSQ